MDSNGAAAAAAAASSGKGQKKNNPPRGRRGGGGKNKKKQRDGNESNDTTAPDDSNPNLGQPNLNRGPGKGNRSNNAAGGGKRNNNIRKKNPNAENQSKNNNQATASENENGGSKNQNNRNRRNNNENIVYPKYWKLQDCLARYNAKDPDIIRGTLRVLPVKDAMSFCRCDRGSQNKDVIIDGPLERNRALDGDTVLIELLPHEEDDDGEENPEEESKQEPLLEQQAVTETSTSTSAAEPTGDKVKEAWWQDDPIQISLWDPVVPIQRKTGIAKETSLSDENLPQRRGRVVHVVPPKSLFNEIDPTKETTTACRKIVGTLKRLQSGTALLTSANKSLTQFRLSKTDQDKFMASPDDAIFQAKYVYGSWKEDFKWPPCTEVVQFGLSCNVQDETTALLIDNKVDHGEFPASVLDECQQVVASGEYSSGAESGWKPTPEMYQGRKDYRKARIFTIDPTTAKDLDDALHITELDNGQIELGVHIADVSYFIQPESEIDIEAQRRCTTVYLVDRTIPMLPRPLCEIACSLNENVERLAFSCVWRMNRDGSLVKGHEVWYGRTVIKSCARLDYATAQNIIERKVAFGENEVDEGLWPMSRRPTGGHTIEQVAADVRLMNEVAQARRSLRFRNGAVALNAVKLTFQLDSDGETPLMCQPYPIRDSNRLVEEYMLLANYLVAQRLITHAGGRACLRNHESPLYEGLEKVVELAQEAIGFRIDISTSEALQRSLNRLGRECEDELVLMCITEMLKMPMRAATYIAAGNVSKREWAHFALNIPYYTHFTSPIRRYADVIVHRLLQASLEGEEAVDDFSMNEKQIGAICERCNEKKDGSRKAQERSDVVFLALYLRRKPWKSQMGVVLSVGQKTFTVFIPSLGLSTLLYLDEHKSWIDSEAYDAGDMGGRRIKLKRTAGHDGERWKELLIKNFTKIRVTCKCQDKPPINVKLELEGPWTTND
jgi:DIS3-like exonuclease 2